jgi:hypothetical protein
MIIMLVLLLLLSFRSQTFGVGAFAMAAAPAITRFVGRQVCNSVIPTTNLFFLSGGNAKSAMGFTLEMDRICLR